MLSGNILPHLLFIKYIIVGSRLFKFAGILMLLPVFVPQAVTLHCPDLCRE